MKKIKMLSLRTKCIGAIILMAATLSLILGFMSISVFQRNIDAEYMDKVTDLAETVSVAVDMGDTMRLKEAVQSIYDGIDNKVRSDMMGTPEYDAYIKNFEGIEKTRDFYSLQRELREILTVNEVQSVYIIYIDPVEKTCVYLVDASDEACPPGNADTLYEVNYRVLEDPEIGFPAYITNTPEYGWLVTAAAPIHDNNGEVIAYSLVDISMNHIMDVQMTFRRNLAAMMLTITVLISIIYIIAITKAVIKPINTLSDAALDYFGDEEANGNKNDQEAASGTGRPLRFSNISINTGDEIENLADAMKKMERDINDYIDNLTKVTAEKERIGAELNVATQIQADMLPRIFPPFPDRNEFDIYATMDPAKEVGGDFYDFFLIDEDHMGLVMADVSGKGVPAALFMVIAKTLIKNRALMNGSPSEVLAYANDQLCEGNEAELFVTVWFAIFEISTGKGMAANAGHEHPVIKRKDGDFELVVYRHSPAVATMEGIKFKEHEFELHPGDTLFVYTDGVAEATNASNELFGTERMLEALNKDKDAPAEQLLKNVKEAIDDFVGEAPQFDDITMLGFKYFGKS